MFHTFEADKAYLAGKFQHPELDPATGLDNEAIKAGIARLGKELEHLPRPVAKARAFEYVTRNVRIDVNPHDWFVGFGCWNRYDRPLTGLIDGWSNAADQASPELTRLRELCNQTGATRIWKDFDHSVPDWDAVYALGFPGLRERARDFRKFHRNNGTLTPEAAAYFDGIEITYTAILELLERFYSYALDHAGPAPAALHRRNRLPRLHRRADRRSRAGGVAGEAGRHQLSDSVLHADPLVQHLPGARLCPGRACRVSARSVRQI